MRRTSSGLTLVEVLILVALLCFLATCCTPDVVGSRDAVNALSDAANLKSHHSWLLMYKRKQQALPQEGGHRFLMSTWVTNVFDHTPENFDRFWVPGLAKDSDAHHRDLRKLVERGENPWPSLMNTASTDTYYVGRSKAHMRTAESNAEEAWMADDNEGGWSLRDGTINVLFAGGHVRTYSYSMLREQFGLGPFSSNDVVATWGPNSPIPPCRELDN